ncbi:MAG: hypothetical protein HQL71_09485 [Magnetococcales bacterium]|nr:hypothetical protein [Magnetococcales bacterium]
MVNVKDPASFPSSKLITCVLPDDGKDSELLKLLKDKKDIITANSFKCRSTGVSSEGKKGKKLEVEAVRVVTIVVPAKKADEYFEYIFETTEMNNEDGGFMYQSDLVGATPFVLPEGIADEVED